MQEYPYISTKKYCVGFKNIKLRTVLNQTGCQYTEWRMKCHTIDCARNTFLLLQKHLTPVTELILIGWKIVPNEEHVQCDHHFASQPPANARHNFTMWALSCATFPGLLR